MLPRMNANHFIRSAVIRGKRRKFCGTDTIDVATISRFECWKKWSANGSVLSVSIDRIYRESADWMRETSRFSLSRRIQSRHARSVRIAYGRPFPTRKSSRFRVGDREIPAEMGRCEKKEERERRGLVVPFAVCHYLPDSHGLPWYALVITWHYPTVFLWTVNAVPWISSKRCLPPLRVANAVSSKATPRLPSPSVDSARISRSAKSFLHFVPRIYYLCY